MHTELGRSQVEVQQCTLSWEVGKVLGEESWQRAGRRVGKAEVQVEVDADMVEEKLEEEARRRKRTASRGGGGGRGGGRGRALTKSNNPHLAGGEKITPHDARDDRDGQFSEVLKWFWSSGSSRSLIQCS